MLNMTKKAEQAIALHARSAKLVLRLSTKIGMHASYAGILLAAASKNQISASECGRLVGYTLTGAKRSMLELTEAGHLEKLTSETGRIVGWSLTQKGLDEIEAAASDGEDE